MGARRDWKAVDDSWRKLGNIEKEVNNMSENAYVRFPLSAETKAALEKVCAREYLTVATFARQSLHNELVRRGYLPGGLVGAVAEQEKDPEPTEPTRKRGEPF